MPGRADGVDGIRSGKAGPGLWFLVTLGSSLCSPIGPGAEFTGLRLAWSLGSGAEASAQGFVGPWSRKGTAGSLDTWLPVPDLPWTPCALD